MTFLDGESSDFKKGGKHSGDVLHFPAFFTKVVLLLLWCVG